MNRFRADLLLLLVAFIWGSAFAVQRVATQYFSPFTFNGLRFMLGGLILLPFSRFNPFRKDYLLKPGNLRVDTNSPAPYTGVKTLVFILLAGGVLFGAASLQQAGLETTTAGNAAFITTLYVVLVPIILVIFWREKIPWISWIGAAIAIVGSLLLSTGGRLYLSSGDMLEMGGAVFWALHVIVVSRAVRLVDVFTFSAGQYLTAGVLNLVVSAGLGMTAEGVKAGWWTVIYIGVLSTALAYTLQVFAQKYAPPTDTTILLSMEAVIAAIAGFIFLGENMIPMQLIGCGMILLAVAITQVSAIRFKGSMI